MDSPRFDPGAATVSPALHVGTEPTPDAASGWVSLWSPVWVGEQVCDGVLESSTGGVPEQLRAALDTAVGGARLSEIFPEAAVDGRLTLFCATAQEGHPFTLTRRVVAGGPMVESAGHRLGNGQVVITRRDLADAASRDDPGGRSGTRWERLLGGAPLGVALTTFDGHIFEVNQAFCELLGLDADDAPGRRLNDLGHPEDTETRLDRAALLATGRASLQKRYLHSDGRIIWLRITVSMIIEGHERFCLNFFEDITEELAAKAELERRATIDELTGLWNRETFHQLLRGCLQDVAAGRSERVAVVFLDVDHFKVINDSLGHNAGDRLLAEIASRLRGAVPASGVLGRMGGDEFAVVLPGGAPVDTIGHEIGRILRQPVLLDGRPVTVRLSAGLAIAGPDDVAGAEPEIELLRDADTALYAAKKAGGACVVAFDEQLRQRAVSRLDDEQDLRLALARGELLLHYQPIRRVRPGGPAEYEALVRWLHPTRGLLAPAAFIDVAEETGLILPLGRQVLEMACAQVARWREREPSWRSMWLPPS